MAHETLPSYLALAKPNSIENRGPWYKNIAPSYFGIFMWIAFYDQLGGALGRGGLDVALGGLVVAAVLSHYMFYYVFGLLGMRTGYPLYVVGSSTFGTKGGLLFPGIFMGLLQIGWYSVGTFYATKLMLGAFGQPDTIGPLFIVVAIAWGYIFALFGAFGIQYVARVSSILPWVAVAMLAIAAVCALPHVAAFKFTPPAETSVLAGACLVIQMVIGFFATAGAAGVDFGTAARDENDVAWGGLTGISGGVLLAGGLALVTVAGAQGIDPKAAPDIVHSLPLVSPGLAKIMLLLLAIGSMAPACFCSSIIGNSLSTMIPSIGRVPLTLGGATIGILLAVTGLAGKMVPFFGFIGASFGPICGAIVADYFLSGRRWAGPRQGVNVAGYTAWVVGFLVGICNNGLLGDHKILAEWQPTSVYSFIVGFVVYAILAKAGLQPPAVPFGGSVAPAKKS